MPIHRVELFRERDATGWCHPVNSFNGGISISGNKRLLGCDYGDMIVALEIKGVNTDGSASSVHAKPYIKLVGHTNLGQRHTVDSSFSGCLVGSGNATLR